MAGHKYIMKEVETLISVTYLQRFSIFGKFHNYIFFLNNGESEWSKNLKVRTQVGQDLTSSGI
jgi:hypothetical protein